MFRFAFAVTILAHSAPDELRPTRDEEDHTERGDRRLQWWNPFGQDDDEDDRRPNGRGRDDDEGGRRNGRGQDDDEDDRRGPNGRGQDDDDDDRRRGRHDDDDVEQSGFAGRISFDRDEGGAVAMVAAAAAVAA